MLVFGVKFTTKVLDMDRSRSAHGKDLIRKWGVQLRIYTHANGSRRGGCFYRLLSDFAHDISKTDSVRTTKLHKDMFHHESWNVTHLLWGLKGKRSSSCGTAGSRKTVSACVSCRVRLRLDMKTEITLSLTPANSFSHMICKLVACKKSISLSCLL